MSATWVSLIDWNWIHVYLTLERVDLWLLLFPKQVVEMKRASQMTQTQLKSVLNVLYLVLIRMAGIKESHMTSQKLVKEEFTQPGMQLNW